MRKVIEFDVVDHGVDYPDYFPGCGVPFTKFEYAVTGIGDSAAQALDDALEQIAMDGDVDVDDLEQRIGPYPDEVCIDQSGPFEAQYYLTIRYR